MPDMLSPNFALDEFIFSQTAVRSGIDNTPDVEVLLNLKHLASQLELIRAHLGNVSIRISSGYRSPALNVAVGGSRTSRHTTGLAVDFTAPAFGSVLETARAVAASGVPYEQLIYEFGRWVHLEVPAPGKNPASARRQDLSIMVAGNYVPGIGTA